MHNEIIKLDSIMSLIKKNPILVVVGGIILISTISAASYVSSSSSNEITYQDNIGNSMTFNPSEHSFIIKNASGFIVSGTYTETSESYNCRNDQGSGETILKVGNNKISYKGHELTRK